MTKTCPICGSNLVKHENESAYYCENSLCDRRNIESLIHTNPPNNEDVFVVLIFKGNLNFVQKYIQTAKRKNTYFFHQSIYLM